VVVNGRAQDLGIRGGLRWGVAVWVLGVLAAFGAPGPDLLQVQLAIEAQDIYTDQPVVFQITVTGEDQPEPPDLAAVATDFAVQFLGASPNSSTQISVINGRVSRVAKTETVLSYRLTPRKAGQLTIPSFVVRAGAKQAMTQPVPVRVRDAAAAAGPGDAPGPITLRMALSKETVCVGEPVVVTWTWTVGAQVRGFETQLPVFAENAFDFPKIEPTVDPRIPRDRYLAIALPDGRQLVALQTPRRTATGTVTDVVFSQILIPQEAGTFTLPKSTLLCEVVTGAQPARRRQGPFGDPFFDGAFGQRETVRRMAVVSNEPTLAVRPLPEQGRPPGFAGHVGRYLMRVSAEPTEVNVGDPITVTIEVSGPAYLDKVEGPDLDAHEELNRDFRVSPPEPGIVQDDIKVFKRVLRAKNADVTAIPALRLPYYDSEAQEYRVAESAPIPVTVKAVKVVTALDAEGTSAPVSDAGRKLQAWSRGIAANYEDLDALADQHVGADAWLHSPLWGAGLVLPPVLYVAVLSTAASIRRRNADPAARRARQALSRARRELKASAAAADGAPARILEALREYFGATLRLSAGALVFRDIEGQLRERGVADEDLATLQDLFATCEAGRYARGLGGAARDPAGLADTARRLVEGLDRRLRSP